MANMVKGLTAQFMKSVSPTGLTLLPALTTSAKSIFTMIGYIMKNRQIAIGIDTTGAPFTDMASSSNVFASSGASLPRATPPTMHRPTHTVR